MLFPINKDNELVVGKCYLVQHTFYFYYMSYDGDNRFKAISGQHYHIDYSKGWLAWHEFEQIFHKTIGIQEIKNPELRTGTCYLVIHDTSNTIWKLKYNDLTDDFVDEIGFSICRSTVRNWIPWSHFEEFLRNDQAG